MDAFTCSLHALIACFSWQNFYVHGALAYEDIEYCELDVRTNRCVSYSTNPQGDFGVGWRFDISPKLSIDFRAYGHKSSLTTNNDRGLNYAALSFDWRPFRH